MIDAIQLSKDILASRLRTIEYNERVLNGILCPFEYGEHVRYLRDIEYRVVQWRQEWT